jgi:hypothetical protein
MTGSALAPVVVVALAAWLAMIYYADAHPGYRTRRTASEPGAVHADTPQGPVCPDGKVPQDGDEASGEWARPATARRAPDHSLHCAQASSRSPAVGRWVSSAA